MESEIKKMADKLAEVAGEVRNESVVIAYHLNRIGGTMCRTAGLISTLKMVFKDVKGVGRQVMESLKPVSNEEAVVVLEEEMKKNPNLRRELPDFLDSLMSGLNPMSREADMALEGREPIKGLSAVLSLIDQKATEGEIKKLTENDVLTNNIMFLIDRISDKAKNFAKRFR